MFKLKILSQNYWISHLKPELQLMMLVIDLFAIQKKYESASLTQTIGSKNCGGKNHVQED